MKYSVGVSTNRNTVQYNDDPNEVTNFEVESLDDIEKEINTLRFKKGMDSLYAYAWNGAKEVHIKDFEYYGEEIGWLEQ